MVSPKSGPSRRIVPCAPLRDADGDGAVPGLRIRPLLRLNGKKGKEARSSPRGHARGIMTLFPQTHYIPLDFFMSFSSALVGRLD